MRTLRAGLAMGVGLYLAAPLAPAYAQPAADNAETLAPALVEAIVTHGPWPPPPGRDPSNALSGDANAIALGRRLFFDARLSPTGRVACSSCHRPEGGWTDGRARSKGIADGLRNTPSLYDVRLHRRFGWSGQGATLWQQSIRPLLDPVEMGSSAEHVRLHIRGAPDLLALFEKVSERPVSTIDDASALETAAKALAAYQETISSGRTTFDVWRDALASRDAPAAQRYSRSARRGAALFVGELGCNRCHSGPAFSDSALHLLDNGAREAIRTPGLRQTLRTGPYFHDGRAPTLADAILAHGTRPPPHPAEVADLVNFIGSLNEAEKR